MTEKCNRSPQIEKLNYPDGKYHSQINYELKDIIKHKFRIRKKIIKKCRILDFFFRT